MGFIMVEAREFSLLHIGSGTHQASNAVGTRVLSWVLSSQGVKLTAHFHAVLRLRMSAAI